MFGALIRSNSNSGKINVVIEIRDGAVTVAQAPEGPDTLPAFDLRFLIFGCTVCAGSVQVS
jgi:hypothetical protein